VSQEVLEFSGHPVGSSTMEGDPRKVVERMEAARDAHDLDALLDCFHEDFRSEQPLHPDWSFVGKDTVRKRWSSNFVEMPELRAELLSMAVEGEVVWGEHRWSGRRADGQRWEERGVILWGVRNGKIAWARLYTGDVPGTTLPTEALRHRQPP
jgi:ketosteroid isomerase-like protein